MDPIIFPDNFPTINNMFDILKKTIEKSWKNDLDIDDITQWLTNFKGDFFQPEDEKRLALWLLCNFTYYNENEINHLCSFLFKNLVHQMMVDNNLSTEVDAENCILSSSFTCIGRASESGGLMLYHFRQEAHLDLDRFIFPTDIYKLVNCIL